MQTRRQSHSPHLLAHNNKITRPAQLDHVGQQLTIIGEPGSLVIDEQQRAMVLCGNIPTANATVFVIDRVLMPPPA